ncbi:hypothetical protein C9374_008325 [Naegleria lovaniensis]|uniref:DH domain-containing protein n=1 Tax=Naegleria lovaniensis TaxID=51637 RepID=A0AA88GIV9_NAELO|nr:uncharacterized protein C9374_008325 [Naegleria lovaniensis]KAG2378182.1 hypothetical protein C9374_008325 [Naegleria lovaniensis]
MRPSKNHHGTQPPPSNSNNNNLGNKISNMSHGDLLDFFLSDVAPPATTIATINNNNNTGQTNNQNWLNNTQQQPPQQQNALLFPTSFPVSGGGTQSSSSGGGGGFNPRARQMPTHTQPPPSTTSNNNTMIQNYNINNNGRVRDSNESSSVSLHHHQPQHHHSHHNHHHHNNTHHVSHVHHSTTTGSSSLNISNNASSNSASSLMPPPPSRGDIGTALAKSVTEFETSFDDDFATHFDSPTRMESSRPQPPSTNIVPTPLLNAGGNKLDQKTTTSTAESVNNKNSTQKEAQNIVSTSLTPLPQIKEVTKSSESLTSISQKHPQLNISLEAIQKHKIQEPAATSLATTTSGVPSLKKENSNLSSNSTTGNTSTTVEKPVSRMETLKNLNDLTPNGKCQHKCQLPGCICYCSFDHSSEKYKEFIENENGGVDFHMCSNAHFCPKSCSHRGYCEIKAEAKYNDVGLKHLCSKMLKPYKFVHEGKCMCYNDEDVNVQPRKHFCTKKCPACLSICRKEYGHDKHSFWISKRSVDPKSRQIDFESLTLKEQEELLLHDTEHTNMINTIFVTDSKLLKNNAIEIPYIYQNQERTLRFFPGQNGAKFTCETYCRVLGRGHTYLTLCHHEHAKRIAAIESTNSSASDLSKLSLDGDFISSKRSASMNKSPSNGDFVTPKNSDSSKIQFSTPSNTATANKTEANVPRSRSYGSYLSTMGSEPPSTSEIPSLTVEESKPSSSSIIHTALEDGIGGVPRGNSVISITSSTATNTTDSGKGSTKSQSPNSMTNQSSTSTSSNLLSITSSSGVQPSISPRGPQLSPRYGREDSFIMDTEFSDSEKDAANGCPFTGELSLMATGRRHSSMKCEHMDELKHDKFWDLCGFVDPCKKACMSPEELRQFNLCRVQTVFDSNQALEYCKRHVSHEVLDSSSLDYLEDIALLAERFPARDTGCIFSPSGHLFKAQPNSGFHHYIFIDVSKNMSSQDFCPSFPVFKPSTKSLKQSEKSEDYSHFTAYDNRLGCAIEIALKFLQILYKLRPSDRMTVAIFTKKTVEVLIDNEELQYYYSVIDLVTTKIKKPENDGGFEEVFTLMCSLLTKHNVRDSADRVNKALKPKIYLLTGNQIESKFQPNFGKTASSSTGTPVWHSLGKLESISLQRKKKKEKSKLDDVLEWFESNGIKPTFGANGESEPYISIIKIGSEGNESKLNQILLRSKGLSTIVDSTLVSANVTTNLTEEDKEDIKKRSARDPFVMQRKVICHMLHELLLIHLEHNKIKLNENMRISGANSASSGKCGLLIKSAIDHVQHADGKHDDDDTDSADSDEELSNFGFASFMIGKNQKGVTSPSSMDILDEIENIESPNLHEEGESRADETNPEEKPADAKDSKAEEENKEDNKQIENEKDNLERENLAKEILDTERAYVTSIAKIIELYYYPLLKYVPNVLSDEDRSTIFNGLLGIYNLHKILVTDLEERVNEWRKDQKIADIFIKLHQTFKLYTSFSTKYEMAIEAFSKYKDSPRFRNFLYIRRKDPFSKGEQLQSFLIKPIQRIPRYILLLKGLLKHTRDPKHPDFSDLVSAISITEEVATFLNNKIRERQYFYRMKSISDRLSGVSDLIQPQRRYICEFDKLYASYDAIQNEECVVFLFNDIFIHAVREKEPTGEHSHNKDDHGDHKSKMSRMKRKLSVKSQSQPHIVHHSNTSTISSNTSASTQSASTSELPSSSMNTSLTIASEGAGGISNDTFSQSVDVMGIMEQSKKDRYEARFVLNLGDITIHPMNFGSQNDTRFQISAISRKFCVEYVTTKPNEKARILSCLNTAINNFMKRKQSFQTMKQ